MWGLEANIGTMHFEGEQRGYEPGNAGSLWKLGKGNGSPLKPPQDLSDF